MERKKENSSAASRDIPAICPAAIVTHRARRAGENRREHLDRADPDRGRERHLFDPPDSRPNENQIDHPHDHAANEERERHDIKVLQVFPDQFGEQKRRDRGEQERDLRSG